MTVGCLEAWSHPGSAARGRLRRGATPTAAGRKLRGEIPRLLDDPHQTAEFLSVKLSRLLHM